MPKRKREDGQEETQRPSSTISAPVTTATETATTAKQAQASASKKQQSSDLAARRISKITDRALRIKASRLQARLEQGTTQLKSVLNLARAFERQKLGRRQKTANDEPHTLLRLREEVILLKGLDLGAVARGYLLKSLGGMKKVRETEAWIMLVGGEETGGGSKSAAESNVMGRLFKAAPVREVVPGIIQGVRDVLGVDKAKSEPSSVASKATPTGNTNGESSIRMDDGQESNFDGFWDVETTKQTLSNGAEHDNDDDVDSDEDDNADYSAHNERLAASSDDQDDNASIVSDSSFPLTKGHTAEVRSSLSISPDQDISDATSPPPTTKPSKPTPSKPLTSTSFLPSLSMGGYYSGSDSDSDLQPSLRHLSSANGGPPLKLDRKNRRGQRARQQIAEKKYGAQAKHLLNPKHKPDASTRQANDGWDLQRGAVDPRRSGKFGRGRGGRKGFGKATGPTGANGDAVSDKRSTGAGGKKGSGDKGAGPLHPSWEAARKRKEAKSGNKAFEGKKITFD